MSSLPLELLTFIFSSLEVEELLQCQLTNKKWCKASLAYLYSNPIINSKKKSRLYIRTISNSPQLGKYLTTIDFERGFEECDDDITFDKVELLNAVIQYCPNVTEIECHDRPSGFWDSFIHAANRGQLSHLKTLPQSDSTNLELYISNALLFKNSLTTLQLRDEIGDYGPQLLDLDEEYQILYDKIDQFKNLQRIDFQYLSDKYLSHFDELIDRCPHLNELILNMDIEVILEPNKLESTIRSCPDIRRLECNWGLINDESQIEYIKRKFPKLQALSVCNDFHFKEDVASIYSSGTIIKFLRHAMSIPEFGITISINKEDLSDVWAEFIKAKNGSKGVCIRYNDSIRSSINLYGLSLHNNAGLDVTFPLHVYVDELPHIRFLSEAGKSIRSLKVINPNITPHINGKTHNTINWLFNILQLCPLLENITICEPTLLLPSHHTLQYPSVKTLKIQGTGYPTPINYLNYLSLNLPNLHRLYLNMGYSNAENINPIIINMPHTSLDLLTWNEYIREFKYIAGAEVYIKLKTEIALKYYLGNRSKLFLVDRKRFLLATNSVRFDISCKSLKELRIRRDIFPESDSDFIF